MGVGGLEDFDANAAAQNLAAAGRPRGDLYALADEADRRLGFAPPVSVELEGPPKVFDAAGNLQPPDPVAAAEEPATTQGAIPGQPGRELPAAEAAPVDVLALPPPTAPAPTGNLAADIEANRLHQDALHGHYTRREQELLKRAQGVNAQKAAADVEVAKAQQEEQQKIIARRQQQTQAAQGQIDAAVQERAAAQGDIEGATWVDKHAGAALVATIFGGIAAGLKDAAAAQLGQVGHAQNEAVTTIDGIMAREYQKRRARLQDASSALMEARHGYKDVRDNALAAQNDLDADFAARWKLVGAEAERRLRQAGASDADIKANGIVAQAEQEAAKLQGSILDRELQRQQQADHNRATEKMADAHMGLAERQIDATISDRRENHRERRREFDERQADKKAAAAVKDEKGEVRDEAGKVIGYVVGGKGGAQAFSTRDADFTKAQGQLEALLKDIDEHGDVIRPEKIKRRNSLYANASAAAAVVSPLGKTNEAIEIEKASIGGSGAGLGAVIGANRDAVARKIEELKEQRERYRKQSLIPVEDHGAPKASAKPEAKPAGKGLDKATVDKLRDTLVNDPDPERRKRANAALERNGAYPR